MWRDWFFSGQGHRKTQSEQIYTVARKQARPPPITRRAATASSLISKPTLWMRTGANLNLIPLVLLRTAPQEQDLQDPTQ